MYMCLTCPSILNYHGIKWHCKDGGCARNRHKKLVKIKTQKNWEILKRPASIQIIVKVLKQLNLDHKTQGICAFRKPTRPRRMAVIQLKVWLRWVMTRNLIRKIFLWWLKPQNHRVIRSLNFVKRANLISRATLERALRLSPRKWVPILHMKALTLRYHSLCQEVGVHPAVRVEIMLWATVGEEWTHLKQ